MRVKPRDHAPKPETGFTLIELLVGLAVGMIVLTGVIFSWSMAVRNNVYILSVSAINNDLRSIMHIVTQDVRRANGDINPATIHISQAGNCISFDANWMDTPDTLLEPQGRGYRLSNNEFQMWASNVSAEDDVPMENRCDSTDASWQTVFINGERGLTIAEFSVSDENSRCVDWIPSSILEAGDPFPPFNATEERCPPGASEKVELLLIEIRLVGTLNLSGSERTFEFQDAVKVRNDIAHDITGSGISP